MHTVCKQNMHTVGVSILKQQTQDTVAILHYFRQNVSDRGGCCRLHTVSCDS